MRSVIRSSRGGLSQSAVAACVGGGLLGWAALGGESLPPIVTGLLATLVFVGLLGTAIRDGRSATLVLFAFVGAAYLGFGSLVSAWFGGVSREYPDEFQIANGANFIVAGVASLAALAAMKLRPAGTERIEPTTLPSWRLLALVSAPLLLAGVVFFMRAGFIPLFATDEGARMAAVSGNTYARTVYQGIAVPSIFAVMKLSCAPRRTLMALALAALTVVALLLTGFRADAGWYVVTLLFSLWLTGRRPSATLIVAALAALAVVFAGVVLVRSGGQLDGGLSSIAMNVIGVHVSNETIIFRFFPDHHPFVLGLTYVMNFITLLPGHQPDVTLWLKETMGFEFAGGGVTPTIAGEAYINFGYVGLAIVAIATGAAIALTERIPRHHATGVVLMALLAAGIAHSIPGGIGNVTINTAWLMVLAAVIHVLSVRGWRSR